MKPALSIICPVFNTRPDHLLAAIDSIASQVSGPIPEIIVVDDASSNAETLAVLTAIAGRDMVRVITLQENMGPSLARKQGVAQARADWICFLDSDDLWPEGSLRHRLDLIQRHPDVRWFGGVTHTLRAQGIEVAARPTLPDGSSLEVGDTRRLTSAQLTPWLIANTRFLLGEQCVRADLLREVNAFSRKLVYGEDWLTFLELSTQSDMMYSGAHVYTLRRQHDSLMSSPMKRSQAYAQSIHMAMNDHRLKPWKKQLRWALYSRLKGIAADNLAHGDKHMALRFGAQALLTLPSGAKDFLTLISLLTPSTLSLADIRRYSNAEIQQESQRKLS